MGHHQIVNLKAQPSFIVFNCKNSHSDTCMCLFSKCRRYHFRVFETLIEQCFIHTVGSCHRLTPCDHSMHIHKLPDISYLLLLTYGMRVICSDSSMYFQFGEASAPDSTSYPDVEDLAGMQQDEQVCASRTCLLFLAFMTSVPLLQFLRLAGKKHRNKEEINFIDVKADDQMDPSEVMKNLTQERPTSSSQGKEKKTFSSEQKRKHQITYLAFKVCTLLGLLSS